MDRPPSNRVSHPFKGLDQLHAPDSSSMVPIEARHRALARIPLHDGVPVDIRQLFDTARNLALYAHYAYRFHQPAELIAYSALEMALRAKVALERPARCNGTIPRGLAKLLRTAEQEGWLREEGFTLRQARARTRAGSKRNIEAIKQMECEGLTELYLPPVTEEEIAAELDGISVVQVMREHIPKLRNDVAHGSPYLNSSSVGMLTDVADAINQLFPESAGDN